MQTYLFYDLETSGLSESFDQVLQFAAIRTDLQLKELERYELHVKLNPDTIPAPGALITHHIGVHETEKGLSELEAIRQIHQWMNTPGTISTGYNTLGFDDEFLRFSFYRNLLAPYTHQYNNQCGRMDIFPITTLFYLFKKSALEWPITNGRVSLKLEHLNQANQLISHGRAHHAMTDVEATLELARRFQKEKEMWEYALGYFNKQTDQERSQHSEAIMVYNKFGFEKNFLAPVLFLGMHLHYRYQMWLKLDSEILSTTPIEEIEKTFLGMKKKFTEPGFILPRKDRYLAQIPAEQLNRAEENKKWLEKNPLFWKELVKYYTNFKYTEYPKADLQSCLYRAFWTPQEEQICQQFHRTAPSESARLLDKITHVRLRTLMLRSIGRHYPELLSSAQQEEFNAYLQSLHQPLIDFKGKEHRTPQTALHEINVLRQKTDLSSEQLALLTELEAYLQKQFGVCL